MINRSINLEIIKETSALNESDDFVSYIDSH